MEKKMELAKFLVKTENFDEIHVYVHGEKAVSVAENLAGNFCYSRISGMQIEAVDEDLVFVTLFPETSIGEAIATLGKLGFAGLYAQVYVGVQQGPCYEAVYPLTGVFEIPGAETGGGVKTAYTKQFHAAQELAAHVIFDGVLYAACTACASVEPETRQRAVFVHAMADEFGDGDCVFFNGAELPTNAEEARALLEESADSSAKCLESIEFVR